MYFDTKYVIKTHFNLTHFVKAFVVGGEQGTLLCVKFICGV